MCECLVCFVVSTLFNNNNNNNNNNNEKKYNLKKNKKFLYFLSTLVFKLTTHNKNNTINLQ